MAAAARRYGAGRRRRWLPLLLGLAATAWVGGFVAFAGAIPQQMPPAETETDAIVVLTGGSLRLDEGLALLEAGAAERLFVSGVHRGVDVEELLRLQKRAPDRLSCCITLGHDAANTVGNARETASWARRNGVRSIRLVTAGYHMPRSLLEFRGAMPEVTILPHPVSPENVKTELWYRYPGTALLIADEYTKFLWVWVRQFLAGPPGAGEAV
jgi:uncharacterized SAM-binding protein YcdF (DUF218 family)